MSRYRVYLTEEDKLEIVNMYKSGKSLRQIQNDFELSQYTVENVLKEYGVKLRKWRGWKSGEKEQILKKMEYIVNNIKKYKKLKTKRQKVLYVSKKLGISEYSCWKYLPKVDKSFT